MVSGCEYLDMREKPNFPSLTKKRRDGNVRKKQEILIIMIVSVVQQVILLTFSNLLREAYDTNVRGTRVEE